MLNNIVYSNCTKKDQTLNQTNIEIPLNKKQENLKKNGGNLSSNEKKFKKKKNMMQVLIQDEFAIKILGNKLHKTTTKYWCPYIW